MVVPTVQSHLRKQVFDGDQCGLTGERRRGAVPVGSWGGAELECMVEIDRKWTWGRIRGRAQIDVAGTGWGWIGGDGAREGQLARLGTPRSLETEMRRVVWSGEQRGGVETEVVCPSLGPEQGSGERGRAYP
jgi:hypothetical protein